MTVTASSDAVRALALCLATRPSFAEVLEHLRYVTFSSRPVLGIVWHELDDTGAKPTLVLIAQHGLTPQELPFYAYIDPEFPTPASEALHHQLPFNIGVDQLTEEYPLIDIREEMRPNGDVLLIPLTVDGFVRSIIVIAFAEPIAWNPGVWESLLAIQQLLCMYHRIMSLTGHGLRPPPRQLAVEQGLSDRQRAILLLVEQDKSTSSISLRLGYSHSTIKKDIRHAMRVLAASDRKGAAARARELGLLDES